MATMLRRPEDQSVAIAEQAATRELVRPEQKTTMRLHRKHIAEGIAVAIMVGVGGERRALHPGGIFAAADDDMTQKTRSLVRQIAVARDGWLTLTSKHGRCCEVVS